MKPLKSEIKRFKTNVNKYFLTPQDTCTALQALSEYARLSYFGGPDLEIALVPVTSMMSSYDDDASSQVTITMDESNKDVLQQVDLEVPNTLLVTAHGDGCGLLQVY